MTNKKEVLQVKVLRYDKVFVGTPQESGRAFIEVAPGEVVHVVVSPDEIEGVDFDGDTPGTKELMRIRKAFDETRGSKGKFRMTWGDEITETIKRDKEREQAKEDKAKRKAETKKSKEEFVDTVKEEAVEAEDVTAGEVEPLDTTEGSESDEE